MPRLRLPKARVVNHCPGISLLLVALIALPGAQLAFASPTPQVNSACIGSNLANRPNFYSLEKEGELGQPLAAEVERSSRILDDSATSQYINNVAHILAHKSGALFPIKVKIIDAVGLDEFTILGGFIFINKGLILYADTESELAGALAFGIANTALRSRTQQTTRDEPLPLAAIPASIGLVDTPISYEVLPDMNIALPLKYLEQRRALVFVADCLEIEYLQTSGYDPASAMRLLRRASSQAVPMKGRNAFNPFPPLTVRLDRMREKLTQSLSTRDESIISSSDFEKIKGRLSSQRMTSFGSIQPVLRKSKKP